jgi:hypothetical protein
MPSLTIAFIVLSAVVSLPYWFPRYLGKMRLHLFRRLFGPRGIELPNQKLGPEASLRLYGHGEARGVALGSPLSELAWYWSFPAPHLHQELIEPGTLYELINLTTRKILAARPETLFPMVQKHFDAQSARAVLEGGWSSLRLTEWLAPTFSALFYEVIFRREGCRETLDLLTEFLANDLRSRKCLELRDIPLRLKARAALERGIDEATRERLLPLSEALNAREMAGYLLVNFFATGVIQLSEALAHVLLEVGKNESIRGTLASEGARGRYVTCLMKEVIRLYPLFDTSQRILKHHVELENGVAFPKGTALYLNHSAYNRAAFAEGEAFRPERWLDPATKRKSIVFGLRQNRPCPAHGFALQLFRFLLPLLLERYDFRSSATHVRGLSNFAPCRVKHKSTNCPDGKLELCALKLADDWRQVFIAARQSVLGKLMAWEALRSKPCTTYYKAWEPLQEAAGVSVQANG